MIHDVEGGVKLTIHDSDNITQRWTMLDESGQAAVNDMLLSRVQQTGKKSTPASSGYGQYGRPFFLPRTA